MNRIRFSTTGLALAALLSSYAPVAAEPVLFEWSTGKPGDTLYVHEPNVIRVTMDPQGSHIYGVVVPIELSFSAGNIIGASPGEATIHYFNPLIFEPPGPIINELAGRDPDTLLYAWIDFGGAALTVDSVYELFRIEFAPRDTGVILCDTILVPPNAHLEADDSTHLAAVEWTTTQILVLPCPVLMGDFTDDGVVNSADIIGTVNCIFKCGGFFDQLIVADVNCSGTTTTADVILLVNYIFRGAPLPDCCMVP